jgi:hypothetical protein
LKVLRGRSHAPIDTRAQPTLKLLHGTLHVLWALPGHAREHALNLLRFGGAWGEKPGVCDCTFNNGFCDACLRFTFVELCR